jgi:prepilin-type N-terminal cleavage/methylation domain-containing protein
MTKSPDLKSSLAESAEVTMSLPAPSSAIRRGLSLVEVMIALGILAIVMAFVSESLASVRDYDSLATAQDDLTVEASRIMQSMYVDLSASAWAFPDNTATLANQTLAEDRSALYFPYVQVPHIGIGAKLSFTQRPTNLMYPDLRFRERAEGNPNIGVASDMTRTAAEIQYAALARGEGIGLTEQQHWERSFFAPSQEFIFLKATVSGWNHDADTFSTSPDQLPQINFRGTRASWITPDNHAALKLYKPSGWTPQVDGGGNITGWTPNTIPTNPALNANTTPYGVVMEAGWLGDSSGALSDIRVNWQTIDGSGYVSTPSENLRAFMYAVVPSPTGQGRLVRAKKVADPNVYPLALSGPGLWPEVGTRIAGDANYGMVIDQVLSDNVLRVCFDTYRTVDFGAASVTTLDLNQVRVRLYMGKSSYNQTTVTRLVENVFTLRARNSATDKDFEASNSTASVLGRAPIGIAR